MSDHELIDQLLDVVPTEATPGNRLKRLDAKYRAPEKLSKLQPRHLLLIEYMTHGISSPVRCRQLRIGVDQPLSLIEAADAARVRRREARRISVDPLFVGELKRQLRAFRELLHPEAIRTMAAIMQEVGENSAADRTVRLKASTTLLGENASGGNSNNVQINIDGSGQKLVAGICIRMPSTAKRMPIEGEPDGGATIEIATVTEPASPSSRLARGADGQQRVRAIEQE